MSIDDVAICMENPPTLVGHFDPVDGLAFTGRSSDRYEMSSTPEKERLHSRTKASPEGRLLILALSLLLPFPKTDAHKSREQN
ncbi:MAG: hypothetical protein ACLP7I_03110 [Limisphaerales bacterium]